MSGTTMFIIFSIFLNIFIILSVFDVFNVSAMLGRLATRGSLCAGRSRRDQRGEGVISAAIAVLIIASLGALMWVGFKTLWENAEKNTNAEISKIGK